MKTDSAAAAVGATEGEALPDDTTSPTVRTDAAWFTTVVHEHSTALVRYFARLGPRQDAEDLAAEVFAIAWRRRDDVPGYAISRSFGKEEPAF